MPPWSAAFVGLALLGIGFVHIKYIQIVLLPMPAKQGLLAAAVHWAWALWLAFNIIFNYLLAVLASPGFTSELSMEELKAAMTPAWRWCLRCNRPKPPLAHHCSGCNRCVLRMDHHCPWLGNCIGYHNYAPFFLFVLWLCIGSGWACAAISRHQPQPPPGPAWAPPPLPPLLLGMGDGAAAAAASSSSSSSGSGDISPSPVYRSRAARVGGSTFFCIVLCGSVSTGMALLLLWHVFVVASGMGTLELMDRWLGPEEGDGLDVHGKPHAHIVLPFSRYPYNLGPAANWRAAFAVSGPLWWLRWLLPRLTWRRPGRGLTLPRNEAAAKDWEAEAAL